MDKKIRIKSIVKTETGTETDKRSRSLPEPGDLWLTEAETD